jgi:hypothetical protein
MSPRRRVALAAYALLLLVFLVVGGPRPTEIRRRVRLLTHDANRDLASRRLDGSSAAFDRRYFFFLESARRKLPRDAAGVAVFRPDPQMPAHVLAMYQFAPRPVLLAPREKDIPSGWILAVYGTWRPERWREIARVSDGALYARLP